MALRVPGAACSAGVCSFLTASPITVLRRCQPSASGVTSLDGSGACPVGALGISTSVFGSAQPAHTGLGVLIGMAHESIREWLDAEVSGYGEIRVGL